MQYRFGAFVFDSETGELCGEGRSARLTEKPARFLEALLEAGGRVVTRDELRESIWGKDVHVDFDANINIIAHRLREALGDSAEQPGTMETIPKRGYRLLLPVSRIEREAEESRRPARWIVSFAIAGTALALIAIATADQDRRLEPIAEPPRSLIVLPFHDLGDSGALASGLTAELTSRLGRIDPSRLSVYAPRTAEAYRRLASASAGVPLRPDYIVEGSVRRSSELVRVTVHLLTSPEMRVVWSEQWDRSARDLLPMQAEIAGRIARAAVPRIVADPALIRSRSETSNPAAFHELAVGRQFWNEFEPEAFRQSLAHFERAVELDPGYSDAWAAVADAWNMLALFGEVDGEEGLVQAEKAARRSIDLDDQTAAGHAALAMTLFHGKGDLDQALGHYQRSIALEPSRALTYQWMAGLYTAMGRPDRAIEAARRAARLDPLSLSVISDLGWYLYYARRFEEAIEQGTQTLRIYPDSASTLFFIELSQRALGRDEDAMQTMVRRLRVENVSMQTIAALETRFREEGVAEVCRQWAETLERQGVDARRLYGIAVYRALAGDVWKARRAVNEAERRGVSWRPYVAADPVLGNLGATKEGL